MILVVRVILTVLVGAATAVTLHAQTTDREMQGTRNLLRAADMMRSAQQFFNAESAAKIRQDQSKVEGKAGDRPDQFVQSCQEIREAIDLFVKFAPPTLVQQTLQRVQPLLVTRSLPSPATLQGSVQQCAAARPSNVGDSDVYLLSQIATTLEFWVRSAWETQASNEKFGSIPDNPSFYQDIAHPSNGVDLLRNLKWASDHSVLLREDFYTSQNMERFLGISTSILRRLSGSIGTDYWARPTREDLTKIAPQLRSNAKCIFGSFRSRMPNGALRGALTVDCNYVRMDMPDFEQVTTIFGSNWQRLSPRLPPLVSEPPPPLAPHGNTRMFYSFSDGSTQRTIDIQLWPEAIVHSIQLIEVEY